MPPWHTPTYSPTLLPYLRMPYARDTPTICPLFYGHPGAQGGPRSLGPKRTGRLTVVPHTSRVCVMGGCLDERPGSHQDTARADAWCLLG